MLVIFYLFYSLVITALPIPMTPRWLPHYAAVSRLFTCDLMLYLIHTLLTNMVTRRSRLRAESHFEKVLHLITLALHEDKQAFLAGDKSLKFINASQAYYREQDYSSSGNYIFDMLEY